MRRTHKYADGGKVVKDHTTDKKPKQPPPPKPADLGSGMAAKAGDALKNARKKQMEDLGL